jgi:hypothetical protein
MNLISGYGIFSKELKHVYVEMKLMGKNVDYLYFLLLFSKQWIILEIRHTSIVLVGNHEELCSVFAIMRKNSVWIWIWGLKQQTLEFVNLGSLNNELSWADTFTPITKMA